MRALITGANGQLGRALQALLPDAIATGSDMLDITDGAAVAAYDLSAIDVIFNAAAFTGVDKAEDPQTVGTAWKVNADGVANLATAAARYDCLLVHVSTDYVFDGSAHEPYRENHPLQPIGMYGRTKAAGEMAAAIAPRHYIVRTSWVFGDGPNFVRTMLRVGPDHAELTVVDDQVGRPTYAPDLAAALVELATNQPETPIYHFSNGGDVISWAQFATAIFKAADISCTVKPVSTKEYSGGKKGIAPRPAYSALSLDKINAAGIHPRDWQAALNHYITKETSQ